MTHGTVGDLVAAGRKSKRWSRQQLAEATGYSAVMIGKIETGERVPSEDKLDVLADALGIKVSVLRAATRDTDGRKGGGLKIAQAAALARQNAVRAGRLKAQVEALEQAVSRSTATLDEAVRDFDRSVVAPFVEALSRIEDLPKDVLAEPTVDESRPDAATRRFAGALREAQAKTGGRLYALVRADVLGGGATSPDPARSTETFHVLDAIARASTLSAIGALVPMAQGGVLGAWAVGGAAATIPLTALAAAPVVGLAASIVVASGGRQLAKQQEFEIQLDAAERELDLGTNASVVRKFQARVTAIQQLLKTAIGVSSRNYRLVDVLPEGGGGASWGSIGDGGQQAIRRTAEIVLACMTVLSLPIMLTPKSSPVSTSTADDGELQRVGVSLEVGDPHESAFVDYVIDAALGQVAK